jgi:hypothetical protein
MAGRVGIDLEVTARRDLFQDAGTQGRDRLMGRREVVDPQVEMDLLRRRTIRPVRGDVVRRQLYSDPRFTADHHHVPVTVAVNFSVEDSSPECALSLDVCRVEGDDLPLDPHARILAGPQRLHAAERPHATPDLVQLPVDLA